MDIALALGGGGVKGYAHIGVLRVMEREGFRIRAIAGTSAGGMIGAIYAAGFSPDEIEQRLKTINPSHMYTRQPGDGPSMMGLAGVVAVMEEMLNDCTFDRLRVPLAVTAVNLERAQLVAIRSGRVLDAIMATIAVPGIFPPKTWDGQVLIDGGVLDPVPVQLARQLAPGLPVVAVVLSPPIEEWIKPGRPRLFGSLPILSTYLGRMRYTQALNIFLRSVDIGGAKMTELLLERDAPEVLIRPSVPHIGFLDTANVSQVAEQGEQAAEQVLPALRRAAGWRAWFNRRSAPRDNRYIFMDQVNHDT